MVDQFLDPITKDELTHDKSGTQHLTPAAILAHCDTKFNIPTAADIQANHSTMTAPFQSTADFLEYVQIHRKAILYAQRSGQPISSADQVAIFKEAIIPCGLFEKRMYLFFATNSTVASQTFLGFSNTMIQEWNSVILPSRQSLTVATFAASATFIELAL
jgi:hypothetical protein